MVYYNLSPPKHVGSEIEAPTHCFGQLICDFDNKTCAALISVVHSHFRCKEHGVFI